MKTITTMGAQGDLLLRRVEDAPTGTPREPEAGRHVLAHSETGHHHWIKAIPGAEVWDHPTDPLVAYLRLSEATDLIHARPWDTHETLHVPAGTWEVRRQREYTPDGWRRVED